MSTKKVNRTIEATEVVETPATTMEDNIAAIKDAMQALQGMAADGAAAMTAMLPEAMEARKDLACDINIAASALKSLTGDNALQKGVQKMDELNTNLNELKATIESSAKKTQNALWVAGGLLAAGGVAFAAFKLREMSSKAGFDGELIDIGL